MLETVFFSKSTLPVYFPKYASGFVWCSYYMSAYKKESLSLCVKRIKSPPFILNEFTSVEWTSYFLNSQTARVN